MGRKRLLRLHLPPHPPLPVALPDENTIIDRQQILIVHAVLEFRSAECEASFPTGKHNVCTVGMKLMPEKERNQQQRTA